MNLKSLEKNLGVHVHVRGNELAIEGDKRNSALAERVLVQLYSLLKKGYPISNEDIQRAMRMFKDEGSVTLEDIYGDSIYIGPKKKAICPRTVGQQQYIQVMKKNDLVFSIGPAGTGKTYLAMAMAVISFLKGEVERIILTRPAIEAGEKLGFLPGNLAEKVNPYLRPLYDALHDMLQFDRTQKMLDRGEIEVAPLAFMRGRTLNKAFVILDEAQNCTKEQMKMFLTRLGYESKCVVTGDVTQIDLPKETESGLVHAIHVLDDIDGIQMHYLTSKDVVRHRLVQEIIDAYEARGNKTEKGGGHYG